MSVQLNECGREGVSLRPRDTEKGVFSMHPQYSPFHRFASKIRFDSSGCWIWTAAIDQGGYGRIMWRGKARKAHRILYSLLIGPIPQGLTLDHLCRNRVCVNPDHLQPTTLRVNILRGNGACAQNSRKDRCCKGHLFDLYSTYYDPWGYRECRICRKARRKESCSSRR